MTNKINVVFEFLIKIIKKIWNWIRKGWMVAEFGTAVYGLGYFIKVYGIPVLEKYEVF